MEIKLTEINFFICSTYIDLKLHREEIIKKIKSLSGNINSQEFFGARDQKPIETCLLEVEKSNVFIMLLGWRYGSIETESGKSFTEIEYEKAKALNIPKFIYFIDEEYPVPAKFIDKDKNSEKLITLKSNLSKEYTIEHFTSPEDLSEKVINDLFRELPKHNFKIKQPSKTKSVKTTSRLINKFLTLPKIYYGTEFIINVELGDFIRASEEECEAFSMTYGATIKREFWATDPEIKKNISNNNFIFASFEEAQNLIDYHPKTNFKFRLKAVQGTYKTSTPIYEVINYNYRDTVMYSPYGLNKERVITRYEYEDHLICGFQFVDIEN